MIALLVVIAIVLVAAIVMAAVSVKVVREYQRVVLFRLGRASGARGPGLILINPITDRISWVDLREQYLEVPHQTAITQDNAAIAIDFIIFYKVLDPLTSVLAVQDFKGAAINIASTTLRSVVGDMTLDDVLSKRERNERRPQAKAGRRDRTLGREGDQCRSERDQAAPGRPRGDDPPDGRGADTASRRDRGRRPKAASITVAEGQKQSAILQAEGERQSAELRAQGYAAAALSRILEVAGRRGQDDDDAPVPGNPEANRYSPSTKFVIPVELTSLLAGRHERQWCQRRQWGAPGHPERVSQPLASRSQRRYQQLRAVPAAGKAALAVARSWLNAHGGRACHPGRPRRRSPSPGAWPGWSRRWPNRLCRGPASRWRTSSATSVPSGSSSVGRNRPRAPSQHSRTAAASAGAREGSARASRTAPKITARAPGCRNRRPCAI